MRSLRFGRAVYRGSQLEIVNPPEQTQSVGAH